MTKDRFRDRKLKVSYDAIASAGPVQCFGF